VFLLGSGASFAQPAALPGDDAGFREHYLRHYEEIKDVAPNMVVIELRDRIELIASRGSQVGAASNDRRVRGFESAFLHGLQEAMCRGPSAGPSRPSPTVIEKINAAATAQRLRTKTSDVAELAALAQRLLDSQPSGRWCALTSLDDIR
jgi:hypothetical protein